MKSEHIKRLLAVARIKFPIGTKFTALDNYGTIFGTEISESIPKYNFDGIYVTNYGLCYHFKSDKWANIISQDEPALEIIL